MKGFVGIKFLLTHGSFLQVVVTEEDAKDIIEKWRKHELQDGSFSSTNAFGTWAVKGNAIIGVHTMPLEQQPVVGPQPGRGPSFNFKSGA